MTPTVSAQDAPAPGARPARPVHKPALLMMTAQYAAAAVSLLAGILAANMLGAYAFGIASAALAFPTLVWSTGSVKSTTAITRYVARYHATGDAPRLLGAVRLGLLIDAGVALLVCLIVGVGTRFAVTSPDVRPLSYLYALHLPFLALDGTALALLTGLERFRTVAVLGLAQSVLLLALVGGALAGGLGATGYVGALTLANVGMSVAMGGAALHALRASGYRGMRAARATEVRELGQDAAGFLGWNFVLTTLTGLVLTGPQLAFERLGQPEQAGFYRIAFAITTAATYPMIALTRVLYPRLSRQETDAAGPAVAHLLRTGTARTGLGLFAMIATGALLAPVLVGLLYTADYQPVSGSLRWMLLAVGLESAFFWLQAHFFARGAMRAYVLGYLTLPIALGVAFAQKAPTFEAVGLAYALGRAASVLLWLAQARALPSPRLPDAVPP